MKALPLPYTLGDEDDPTQGNFDFIRKRFPLTRKDMALHTITRDRLAPEVEDRPRFRVWRNAAVSYTNNSVIVWDTVDLDTHGWFSTSTGLYTPQRAGSWRLSAAVRLGAALTADNFMDAQLIKNGGGIRLGNVSFQRGTAPLNSLVTANVDVNGSSDTLGVIVSHNQGVAVAMQVGNILQMWFDGEWIGA